jgi:hypothetical protein
MGIVIGGDLACMSLLLLLLLKHSDQPEFQQHIRQGFKSACARDSLTLRLCT